MPKPACATTARAPLAIALVVLVTWMVGSGSTARARQDPPNELDAFMARVLERREESWRQLHDYVLDERVRFALVGAGRVRLHGLQREFTWYVREGFFVRSPVRVNDVTVPETDRRRYEDRWLEREKSREARRRAKDAAPAQAGAPEAADQGL